MKNQKIAVIGECMVELQKVNGVISQSFGGDTLNTALYLTRLTEPTGMVVSYVTALGKDPFSEQMLSAWQSEGIDTSLVVTLEDKQPGIYHIETDAKGERRFFYWRNDSAAKFMFEQIETKTVLERLQNYDAVYLSGITLAILTDKGRKVLFDFLAQFKRKGGKVYFDNNFRAKLWSSKETAQTYYKQILKLTDIALLTFEDEQELFGDRVLEECISRTSDAGVREIIIKRGGEDCLVVSNEQASFIKPQKIDCIIDTTAAGDSFSSGYLANRLAGGEPNESAAFGHQMAGNVIQHQGAIIPRENMPQLELSTVCV
ncbi:sugar kinase [Vibrio sonorensis]|uniref:sugar kinase n=1 Tax=Vibrio sonorensis TaxID=1004316 RepID=UPI0008DAFF27|nr:sugar kinase [Vibrio sonorensis]